MAVITIKNWYQLDFVLPEAKEAKSILIKIDELMSQKASEDLVDSWFFLFEGDTVRVRMSSKNKETLRKRLDKNSLGGLTPSDKLPFSDYEESDETMFNEDVALTFAKTMSEVTSLTIKKLKGDTSFENYRVLERLQHCMFNILLTLGFKSEEHFLTQRLYERLGKPSDKDFENKL